MRRLLTTATATLALAGATLAGMAGTASALIRSTPCAAA